jgi:isohexenylglutaconyl-CoA hydratase
MGPFDTLVHRLEAGVLHLTLNRPEVRNAMSLAMVRELHAALAEAETDSQVRIIVLRGAGGHFCAGGDISDMAAAYASTDHDAVAALSAQFGELCVACAQSGNAVVAVLEGSVMGGGLGLACVADFALASETAVFRLPETTLGLVPAQIAPFLLERIGYAEAKRLIVTAGKLDAHEAFALRLVHEVHTPAMLDAALTRVLHTIQQSAPAAIAASKRLLAHARFVPALAMIHEAAAVFAHAALGDEGREGTAAFLQKRKPAWANVGR